MLTKLSQSHKEQILPEFPFMGSPKSHLGPLGKFHKLKRHHNGKSHFRTLGAGSES